MFRLYLSRSLRALFCAFGASRITARIVVRDIFGGRPSFFTHSRSHSDLNTLRTKLHDRLMCAAISRWRYPSLCSAFITARSSFVTRNPRPIFTTYVVQ